MRAMVSSFKSGGKRGAAARGGLYIFVLFASALIAVIGISGLTLLRVQARIVETGTDAYEARLAAQAGVEYAVWYMNNRSDWRTAKSSGVWFTNLAVGDASVDITVTDPVDGSLSNNPSDNVRIDATARLGRATQKVRATAAPWRAIDCLSAAIHTGSSQTHSGTFTGSGGLSSNGLFIVNLKAYLDTGDVCTASLYTVLGTVVGQTNFCAAKSLPGTNVFNYYQTNGTQISYGTLPSGKIEKIVLSSSANPYGSANTNGLYWINIGSQDLTIQNCRIKGTLLVVATSGQVIVQNAVVWEPASASYAALLVNGAPTLQVDVSGTLDESALNVNFNPSGLPLDGAQNSTKTDKFASRLYGVVYANGNLQIGRLSDGYGAILADGALATVSQKAIRMRFDATLPNSPPLGFHDYPMKLTTGSWQQIGQ